MSSTPPEDDHGQPDYGQPSPGQPDYGQASYGQADYGQQPAGYPGNPYGDTPATRPSEMPASVATAVKLLWANIGLSVLSTLVTFLMLDSIIDNALADADVSSTISTDTIRTGVIATSIFGLIVGVGIFFLLLTFIKKGANWARIVYSVLGGIGVIGGLLGIGSQPPVLLVLSLVSLALTAGTLFYLWQKDSGLWFKPAVH